jgi:hypothetical protein
MKAKVDYIATLGTLSLLIPEQTTNFRSTFESSSNKDRLRLKAGTPDKGDMVVILLYNPSGHLKG